MGGSCSRYVTRVDGVPVVKDSVVESNTRFSTAVLYNGTEYTVWGNVPYKKGALVSIWKGDMNDNGALALVEVNDQNVYTGLNEKTILKGNTACEAERLAARNGSISSLAIACLALLCVSYGFSFQNIPSFSSGCVVVFAAPFCCPFVYDVSRHMYIKWGVANW